MSEPIAIVGMGCRFAGSRHLLQFWKTVRDGRTCFSDVPEDRWKLDTFFSENRRSPNQTYSRSFGTIGDIRSFGPELFGISPARARQMDPQQRLFLEITRCALEDAGYARRSPSPQHTGVFLGISTCEHRDYLSARLRLMQMLDGDFGSAASADPKILAKLVENVPAIQPSALVGQMLNMAAANVAQAFDFRGPAFAVDAACSSALVAVHEAMLHLRARNCDVAVAGGVYLNLTPDNFVGFSRVGALSRSDTCRPLDERADGFVIGEGAGSLVLRRLDDAVRDGDSIWAVIRGAGTSNDGGFGGPLAPSLEGQMAALRAAYQDAAVAPASVGFVEIHGTGTPVGDQVEVSALREVMDSPGVECFLSSTKANIGHTLAAAGAASLIRAALAIAFRWRPPQAALEHLSDKLSLRDSRFRVSTAGAPWEAASDRPRRAGVSGFGFGGTNVHLVLEEAPAARSRRVAFVPSRDKIAPKEEEFVLAAPNTEILSAHVAELLDSIRETGGTPLEDIACTLRRRNTGAVKVRLRASTHEELQSRLVAARALAQGEATADSSVALASDSDDFSERLGELDATDARLCPLPPSPADTRPYWALRKTVAPMQPPSRPEVFSQVIAIVAEVAFVSSSKLKAEMRLAADLGFDSLMSAELVAALEKAFPVLGPMHDSFLTGDPSLQQVATLVSSRTSASIPQALPKAAQTRSVVTILADDPRVAAHRIGKIPILPLAAALDIAAEAAKGAGLDSTHTSLRIRDLDVLSPIQVRSDQISLIVTCSRGPAGQEGQSVNVEIGSASHLNEDPQPAYRCRLDLVEGGLEALVPDARGTHPTLQLSDFYDQYTFHAPPLQAIEEVTQTGDRHIVGLVKSARQGPLRGGCIDLLALDGALQLCAFWARRHLNKAALPIGFGELRILGRIAPGSVLRCVAVLNRIEDLHFSGHLDLQDEDGRPLLQMRGLRGRLMDTWSVPGEPDDQPRRRFETLPAVAELRERMIAAAQQGLGDPYFQVHQGTASDTVWVNGRECVNFASYNYLGLSGDPDINRAACEAVERYGTSVSASRVASGERPLHRELETTLANLLGCEDALVMVSGHATNVSALGHLLGPEDAVVHDALAHDSLIAGARQSGARRRSFPHNDMAALDRILGQLRTRARQVLVAVEGIYSMDGDFAPLDEVTRIARRHGALVFVDEAHSLGTAGATGRGAGEHFGIDRGDVDIWMGTLSKSLASCGGYVAGSRTLMQYLKYTMPGFIYSVGISPANAAAALAAARKLGTEPDRVARLQHNAALFLNLCRQRGIDTGLCQATPIVPCIVGDSMDAVRLAHALFERGINVQPIIHPAVEENQSRLRFFVTARHTERQLQRTADVLSEELARLCSTKPPAAETRLAGVRAAAN